MIITPIEINEQNPNKRLNLPINGDLSSDKELLSYSQRLFPLNQKHGN